MENPFKQEKKQKSIFITAGYPTIESTLEQIIYLQENGVDFIELGIPFSDPMADGPVIQETSNTAIRNGMNLELLFQLLEESRDRIRVPLVMMGYFNPIFLFGLEKFLERCSSLNIRHVTVPDISLEVYQKSYASIFEKHKVTLCFLVTPLSEDGRIRKMAQLSSRGFIYLVSQNSITGENKGGTLALERRYQEIKQLCAETPMMLGFGIKNKADVLRTQQVADGAIVGTAYLNALNEGNAAEFIASLN